MCWSAGASLAMVGIGTAATGIAIWRREPTAIWAAVAYFTAMEGLQATGYAVVDQCGTPENQAITIASYIHIAFQPLFINAFALQLVPAPVRKRFGRLVFILAGLATLSILAQLVPGGSWGTCAPGFPLCGDGWCTRSGDWHIAWDIPYNGLFVPFERFVGTGFGFPTYMLAVFALPLLYGAWRFAVFHAIVGPIFASTLTADPNEMPAIWCLFSIGIVLFGLSHLTRRQVSTQSWWGRPVGHF